ncbi:MAG: hypothetical protein K1X83_08650 [Oligoflexia bacterium]|nr:hypothetical protein [Oligoflexia bacterium]
MNPLEIFLASLLGGLGLALIVVLLRVFFGGMLDGRGDWIQKIKIKKKEGLLERSEAYLKAGDFETVSSFFKSAFYLEQIKSDPRLVERAHNHNLSILGKILAMADRYALHLDNLAIVEDLLGNRSQLMRTFLEKKSARDVLKRKRAGKGKQPPEWALTEFNAQLDELRDRIAVNRRSLESQLEKLLLSIKNVKKADEVTYH